ncbi:MAG: transposase [Pseudomonadota bacterium]
MDTLMIIDGAIKGVSFLDYSRQVVVIDNVVSHKGAAVRNAVEAACASLRFLAPRSADFSPIENALAKLKATQRNAAARARETLLAAVGPARDAFNHEIYRNDLCVAVNESE